MDHPAENEVAVDEATLEDDADDAPEVDIPAKPEIPEVVPVLPVRNVVVYPGTVMPLTVGREKSKRLIDDVLAGSKLVAIFTQRHEDVEDPSIDNVYRVGTAAQVLKLLRSGDGAHTLLVHGIVRLGLEDFVATDPYWKAKVHVHEDREESSTELEALAYSARRVAAEVIELSPNVPEEALQVLHSIDQPAALADFLAANLSLDVVQKQELLETFDVADRLRKINATLQNQLEVLRLAAKIQTDVRSQIDRTQREYYLQEQMKAIQRELGETDSRAAEIEELRARLKQADMPEGVEREAQRELQRLERLAPGSPENGIIRDYLDWLTELPWNKETSERIDLDEAERILDEDHFGLDRVKRHILEHLAVRKLKPDGKSQILCFVGPPGVGKTSIATSISRALGREFARIALGGVRDEADIRGHRRTYIGAYPGRIIQEIRKVGVRNPVILLDELDKLGADFRGDPASALLEVLDPEQNHTFTDHYLGVPFDLSRVLFIATANYMEPVAAALRDRMDVIELSGYTTAEKMEIAKRYLVKRQMDDNGLADKSVKITDDALLAVIEKHTREPGVRTLNRRLGAIARGLAARVARGKKITTAVKETDLAPFLGPPRYEREVASRIAVPGVATGLAYTPVGGEIIFVEATIMPGRGSFALTGQLGDVMRESAHAALSLIRSHAKEFGVDSETLAKSDIHIHVPAGAIPKDGPSAGVAMLTALISLLQNRRVKPTVGMTGEITLRGLVLPIGGVKEKTLAAHRAGLSTVILPKRNGPDLEDVPAEVREKMKFVLVERVEDVLKAALEPLAGSGKAKRAKATARPKAKKARKPAPKRAKRAAGSSRPKPAGRSASGRGAARPTARAARGR
ncbi:MAG: endopeptidase La [Phycisphaerales bacterium]|nr:endopeptidase La [Phycisphaerales bacterium]